MATAVLPLNLLQIAGVAVERSTTPQSASKDASSSAWTIGTHLMPHRLQREELSEEGVLVGEEEPLKILPTEISPNISLKIKFKVWDKHTSLRMRYLEATYLKVHAIWLLFPMLTRPALVSGDGVAVVI